MQPKLLMAYVAIENAILTADVLQIGDELWLVPEWFVAQNGQWTTPARAIRVDGLQHQLSEGPERVLTLEYPMPKAVLDGTATDGYEVVQGPSDRFGWIANPSRH